MRVTFACDWFLKYTCSLAAAMAEQNTEVQLLCRRHALEFGGNTGERAASIELARASGVTVLEAPGRLWDLSASRELLSIRKKIARFSPDVVHVHHDSVDPRALAVLPHVTTVLTLHDPTVHPGQPVAPPVTRWALESTKRALRRRAKAIVIHSAQLAPEVELLPGQRLAVIPHGLKVLNEPLVPPSTPTIGFFGRLEPYKGIEVLARAMPRVWEQRPEVSLHVTGAGSVDLPLQDPRVRFERRYLPESELEAFFREVTLAVLPYTQASQTGAGSVAIGFGVPVVASRLGGLPDLTLDESYLFEAGQDAALAEAILNHVDDDAAVRNRVLSEVAAPKSWRSTSAQLLELYGELRESL